MSALALPVPEFSPAPPRRRHLVAVPDIEPALPRTRPVLQRPTAPTVPGPARPASRGETVSAHRDARTGEDRLRLTVRGQIVLSVLGLVLAAVFGTVLGLALPADAAAPAEVSTVTVDAGESLWVIAEQIAAPGEDVRIVIDQIMTLNGLADSTLHAGQQLQVPAGH